MRYSIMLAVLGLLVGCSGLPEEPPTTDPLQSGVDRAVERAKNVRRAVHCSKLYKEGADAPIADDMAQSVREGVKQGIAVCQAVMGQWSERGVQVPQSLPVAREWYEKAAAGGIEGNVELARLAEQGIGQPSNPKEAFEWRLHAAEKGDIKSEMIVARAYEQGVGVEANTSAALQWYRKVAARTGGYAEVDDAWSALIRLHEGDLVESSVQLKADEDSWKRIWRRRMSNLMEKEMLKYPPTERLEAVLIAKFTGTIRRPVVTIKTPSGNAGFDAAMAAALAGMPMPPLPGYALDKPELEMQASLIRSSKQNTQQEEAP
jgi:hypothetical protein